MFNNSKFGDGTTISIGDNNIQNVNNSISNIKNDFNKLSDFFKENGILQEDINSLEIAINDDGEVTPESGYGEKVKSWISNMISKAATKVWDIGVTKAGEVIEEGLNSYFGI